MINPKVFWAWGSCCLFPCFELLQQKDCYLRALCVLLQEAGRALCRDINLQAFCLQLIKARPKEQVREKRTIKRRNIVLYASPPRR